MRTQFLGCEFIEVSAICSDFQDVGRINAILIHDMNDEFRDGDCVVFGADLPQDEHDARAVLEEYAYSDWETMNTVEQK